MKRHRLQLALIALPFVLWALYLPLARPGPMDLAELRVRLDEGGVCWVLFRPDETTGLLLEPVDPAQDAQPGPLITCPAPDALHFPNREGSEPKIGGHEFRLVPRPGEPELRELLRSAGVESFTWPGRARETIRWPIRFSSVLALLLFMRARRQRARTNPTALPGPPTREGD